MEVHHQKTPGCSFYPHCCKSCFANVVLSCVPNDILYTMHLNYVLCTQPSSLQYESKKSSIVPNGTLHFFFFTNGK